MTDQQPVPDDPRFYRERLVIPYDLMGEENQAVYNDGQHSRDAEVAELQRQLARERLELQAMRESWTGLVVERDSAREQVRALVEAGEDALEGLPFGARWVRVKAAIGSAKEAATHG